MNNGFQGWQWLVQLDANGNPTGVRKPNVPSDPDYVAPILNYGACPIPTTTSTTTTSTSTTSTTTTSTSSTTTTSTTTAAPKPLKIIVVNTAPTGVMTPVQVVLTATSQPSNFNYVTNSIFSVSVGNTYTVYNGYVHAMETLVNMQVINNAGINTSLYTGIIEFSPDGINYTQVGILNPFIGQIVNNIPITLPSLGSNNIIRIKFDVK